MNIESFILLRNSESEILLKELTEKMDYSSKNLPVESKVNLTLSDFPNDREILVAIKRLEAKMIALRHDEFSDSGSDEKIEYKLVLLNSEHRLIITQRIKMSILISNDLEKSKTDNLWFAYIGYSLQKMILNILNIMQKNHQ